MVYRIVEDGRLTRAWRHARAHPGWTLSPLDEANLGHSGQRTSLMLARKARGAAPAACVNLRSDATPRCRRLLFTETVSKLLLI